MSIDYNDGITGVSQDHGLIGNGVPPAVLTLSNTPTFDFGPRAISSDNDHTFDITHSGGPASSVVVNGLMPPYSRVGGTCGLTISANCTIIIRFTPSLAGAYFDILELDYDCLLYTSPSPRDQRGSRMPSSA